LILLFTVFNFNKIKWQFNNNLFHIKYKTLLFLIISEMQHRMHWEFVAHTCIT
jgi:hypothetical protein